MDFRLFIPITKVDVEKRLVYGTIAEEIPDKSGEIMDYATSAPEFQAWSDGIAKATDGANVGNLRAMHGNVAAGKLTSINFDDGNKKIEACGKVVDDAEWNKVLEGVYTGFSMGGKYGKRWKDADQPHLTRYTAVPAEVSLVDNPCIPTATFEVVKADGSTELRKFKTREQPAPTNVAPDVEQGWKARDGSFHATKAAALKKNAEIDADAVAKAVATPAEAALAKLYAALASAAVRSAGTKASDTADELPDGGFAKKTMDAESFRKGLHDIGRLAELIEGLESYRECVEYEESRENDTSSTTAGQIKEAVALLCRTLRDRAVEETGEIFTDDEAEQFSDIIELCARTTRVDALAKAMGDKAPPWLAKIGARHSRTDQKRVQGMHDTSVDLGADCDCGDTGGVASGGDDAGKRTQSAGLTNITAERDALAKILAEVPAKVDAALSKIAELTAEVDRLNAQPMAGGPVVNGARTITKGQDASGGANDAGGDPVKAFQKHLETLAPNTRALALMKFSLANPMTVAPEPIGKRA